MSELPSSWKWSTIGDLTSYIQRGKSPKYADRSALPVVNQRCIRWNELEQKHVKFIHPDQFSAWNVERYIRPGDVLWNSTGTGTVGRAYLVREEDCIPPKVVDSHVTIVRCAPEVDPRYLFNWIKSPAVQNKIEEMCDGTTNQIELSRTAIAATAIPVAPAAEQTRIADQLDTLLARIQACNDRLDAIPALLKRFRQTVLRHAATGELTGKWRDSQVEPVPAWTTVRVKDVGRVQLGRQRAPQFHAGEHMRPYLRVQNVFEARIDLSDVMEMNFSPSDFERFQLHPGDILLNEGQSPEYLGRPAMYRGELPGACFTNTLIRFQAGPDVLPEFALIVFRSHMHTGRYMLEGKITTNLAHLGAGRFSEVEFPLPSIDEQKEIVRQTDVLLGLARRIEAGHAAAVKQAQRLTPLMLAKAFRGELLQQDQNDEPATVLLQRVTKASAPPVRSQRGRPRTQQPNKPATLQAICPGWHALPAGAWAAYGQPDEHTTTAQLIAVLKAWAEPMPQDIARLAAVLCLQPRLFTAAIPAQEAAQWRHLVGAEAEPLPTSVAALQPAVNTHWRRALAGLRARGEVVSGTSPQDTWALGPRPDRVDTMGWPDGRAGWVTAYLRTHGVEALLPLLPTAAVDFVHARAA